ncbi:MAG: adenine phosphoribosyltransferase [Planctomycetia bacterium]|nr:adenine phosphoribosyltransferase [Planctomycetia bacterium]
MTKINLKETICSIPDFPKPGIIFRDITTLIQSKEAFAEACRQLEENVRSLEPDVIAAPEARGFLFAAPMAVTLGCGLVPIRKPGKLPRKVLSQDYELEYGTDTLTIHEDAILPGQKVVIVDDLLATGGTVEACRKLVEKAGGEVVGYAFVMELSTECQGRVRLEADGKVPVISLFEF